MQIRNRHPSQQTQPRAGVLGLTTWARLEFSLMCPWLVPSCYNNLYNCTQQTPRIKKLRKQVSSSYFSSPKKRNPDSQIDSLAALNLFVMSYLLQLIKANALGNTCSFPQEIIPGDLILNKRHILHTSSIST